MTPDELNMIVKKIAGRVGGTVITEADDQGTSPEIGVELDGYDIVLTVDVV